MCDYKRYTHQAEEGWFFSHALLTGLVLVSPDSMKLVTASIAIDMKLDGLNER